LVENLDFEWESEFVELSPEEALKYPSKTPEEDEKRFSRLLNVTF
jgi:hypothetical protein